MKISKGLNVLQMVLDILTVMVKITKDVVSVLVDLGHIGSSVELKFPDKIQVLGKYVFNYWDKPIIEILDHLAKEKLGEENFQACISKFYSQQFNNNTSPAFFETIDDFMKNKKIVKFIEIYDILVKGTIFEFDRPNYGEYADYVKRVVATPLAEESVITFLEMGKFETLGSSIEKIFRNSKHIPKNWRKIVKKASKEYWEYNLLIYEMSSDESEEKKIV